VVDREGKRERIGAGHVIWQGNERPNER